MTEDGTKAIGPTATPDEDFFDASFLAELEELAATDAHVGAGPVSSALHRKLQAFLAPRSDDGDAQFLTEAEFADLPASVVAERTNLLIEICREGGRGAAVQSVESFVVFFQALLPTLAEEGSRAIKRVFFRLVPTLIHIAHNDFSNQDEERGEGRESLRNLETILIEIGGVRLAPSEGELVFRSIDQMTAFIGVGEYAMANEIISSHLLSIISRNKLTRALYRLMEVEVSIQTYLRERLGHLTPQIRLPDDVEVLSDYGPIRIFHEETLDGEERRFLQVHLPDIPILRDIVLHLVGEGEEVGRDLRLDAVGSAPLDLPDGTYRLGLVYQPTA